MKKIHKLTRIILSFILITNLFIGRSVFVSPVVAEGDVAPTSEPAPTKSPSEARPTNEIIPTSAIQPTSPPQSTPVPQAGEPTPTTAVNENNQSSSGDSSVSPTPDSTSGTETTADQLTPTITSTAENTGASESSVNDPANVVTGALSTNSASENNSTWEETVNNNLAILQNKLDAITSTGFNYANLNTLGSQVFTGDANASLNLLNKLNSNMTGIGNFSVFNIYDKYCGDIVFNFGNNNSNFATGSSMLVDNAVTGPGSTNNSDAQNSFVVKEATGNDAQLQNDINLQAVTGGNSASFNTGAGVIKTGNASALANIVNLVNTNLNVEQWLFGVVNVFGTLAGNIILPQDTNETGLANLTANVDNQNTGALSQNSASSTNSDTASFENSNNATIDNNLTVTANTGGNDASFNTGASNITTGDGSVALTENTIANTNITDEDGTVWLVIVNEMGKWVGHLIGSPSGATSSSGSNTGNNTALIDQNNSTGALSDNNTNYTDEQTTATQNENTAVITNNITVNADTGNNQAKYNTGGGSIETGDASAGLNLMNLTNTNITAKKLAIVFVNVIGEFIGDVVSPGNNVTPNNSQADIPQNNNNTDTDWQIPGGNFPPLPTLAPINIGSTDVTGESNEQYANNTQAALIANNGGYADYSDNTTQTGSAYNSASYTANNYYQQRRNTYIQYPRGQINPSVTSSPVNTSLTRGLFLSPKFAKASETSSAGILFGGLSIKIPNVWFFILPMILVLYVIRRRRTIDIGKYLNSILEIVL